MRRERGQTEDLDGSAGRSSRFAGEAVGGHRLGHDVALAGVHLDVDRRVDRLATQLAHRLPDTHTHTHTHTRHVQRDLWPNGRVTE